MVMTVKDDLKFNVDKRTSRKENAEDFKAGIKSYRRSLRNRPPSRPHPKLANNAMPFKVYVRKRPIFEHELQKGEYDTVTCVDSHTITTHKCNMKPDLKHMFITHKSHSVHGVFDEEATNSDVYEVVARPLLDTALSGNTATLLMYGQTGSGKTHTITGVTQEAAFELFHNLPKQADLVFSSLELVGNQCYDLLNNRAPLKLRDDEQGQVQIMGLKYSPPMRSPEELLQWIEASQAARKSAHTHINASSSRSHLFNRLTIRLWVSRSRQPEEAVLSLVDLAGSERNQDTFWHDADRRKESAQINSSLSVLKQCIRLQTANSNRRALTDKHVPYRQSELTRLLKDSFTDPNAESALIATVSPNGTDTEHALDTLAHATVMASTDDLVRSQEQEVPIGLAHQVATRNGTRAPERRIIPPNRWTADEVQQWLHHVSEGLANVPSGTDGKQLVRLSEKRFVQICRGDQEVGHMVFQALQDQVKSINSDKVASAKASREAQIEHKHTQAVNSAGLRHVKAPKAPTRVASTYF